MLYRISENKHTVLYLDPAYSFVFSNGYIINKVSCEHVSVITKRGIYLYYIVVLDKIIIISYSYIELILIHFQIS